MTKPPIASRTIGRSGISVFPLGLGCASASGSYGPADDEEGVRLIHKALDIGVNFLDTSDKYGWGHNESLLARALEGRRHSVVIASKFGNTNGRGPRVADGRPEHVMAACEASLKRLKTDVIDLYYQHRIDPLVPIEDTVGAMARLKEQGKIRALGLCEVNPATLRRAYGVHPIDAIQSEYSILYREQAEDVLKTMRELTISFVPYAPLGRGLLTGAVPTELAKDDERLRHPRFPQRIWRRTWSWSAISAQSPTSMAAQGDRWRWPGCWPRATTSSPSPAPRPSAAWSRTPRPPMWR